MPNIITSQQTYATVANAIAKLEKAVGKENLSQYRWLIAVTPDGSRYVPTVLGAENCGLAHRGIMVIS